ncbi:MAG: OmpA family protein [Nitrospiraceae bacterium]
MIIKNLSAFTLLSLTMLCGVVPVSMAVGDADSQSPRDELSVTKNHLQQAKQRIDELERQLATGNLENAKRRIGELVIQLHAKDSEITALRSNVYENSKKLREDLASQTEELNQAKRRVVEVEQQLTTGKGQELTQAKRRAADAEQQTTKKDQELVQAKRRVAEIEQQMVGKEQELAQTRRRIADAEQQMVGKEQELTQTRRRVADVEQQMVGKEQELAQARRRFAEAEQQTARKEQELAQARRRPADPEQLTTSGKEQDLAQAKRRVAEAEQQIAKKEQELAQVKDDLKQVTQKLADLNPQLLARDMEIARTKQLLTDLERTTSKQAEPAPAQEDSGADKNTIPLHSLDQNLAVTNLLPSPPALADDTESSSSSDLGKMSESLASLLQPELKKGSATLRQRGNKLTLAFAAAEFFPTGEAAVTLGGTSLLERIGAVLHGFRYQNIEVAGHTDNAPLRSDPRKGFRDNIELSRTRAEHAIQILINGGLEADRVKAMGYADSKPIAANDTEKGRSKNRRIEIVITQWSESGGTVGDTKAQVGKKLQGFSTQTVTHR